MTINPAELESAALKNPLIYGITYVDLLQNRKWDMANRLWQEEIYKAVNPYEIEKNPVGQARRFVVMKSTQCGLSTAGLVKMLHFADMWNVRLMYTLPRKQDVTDFVGTRVDPMVKASPRLRAKLGFPDSTHAKKIGDSFIFFMELSVEPRMMPADALYVDEVDLSDPVFMGTAQNRLDASNWKLNYFFSTPTLPNYGIHGLYLSSDRKKWLVRCKHCGKEQVMDWDLNLRLMGTESNPERIFYGCQQCNEEITLDDIQVHGRWVAERPAISSETVGFHVSQLMTHTAPELWVASQDPQTSKVEFYRKRLGKPFEIGGGVIERQDMVTNCFKEYFELESAPDEYSDYYMGVDQGNELQIAVGKVPKGRDLNEIKLVHAEVVPFDVGFNRVNELMHIYSIRQAVLDANPNRHSAKGVANDFYGKIAVADYAEAKERIQRKKDSQEVLTGVVLGRTLCFDNLYESIFNGFWKFPGLPDRPYPIIDRVIQQVISLRRDVVEEKGRDGTRQIGVWRTLGPDHFAHALVYLKTAAELDKLRGGKFRAAMINGSTPPADAQESDKEETVAPRNPNEESSEPIALKKRKIRFV